MCVHGCVSLSPPVRLEDKVWTVLDHSSSDPVRVRGSSPQKPYVMSFNYSASPEQLRAIVTGSEQCQQEVVYRCRKSRLFNIKGDPLCSKDYFVLCFISIIFFRLPHTKHPLQRIPHLPLPEAPKPPPPPPPGNTFQLSPALCRSHLRLLLLAFFVLARTQIANQRGRHSSYCLGNSRASQPHHICSRKHEIFMKPWVLPFPKCSVCTNKQVHYHTRSKGDTRECTRSRTHTHTHTEAFYSTIECMESIHGSLGVQLSLVIEHG